MNQLLALLMSQLKADKGRDLNRTAVLAGVCFLIWKTDVIDKRLSVVEDAHKPRQAHQAGELASATNDFANVGPEWPRNAGPTWRE